MRHLVIIPLLLGFSLVLHTPSHAAPQDAPTVTVVVQDPSGAPVQNELVILQDLGHSQAEIVRALTNEHGEISPLRLRPGLYRGIATAPYTLWRTRIQEFLVDDAPVRLVVTLELMPPRGYGDVVPVGIRHVRLKVLTLDGLPAAGATVLARDEDATLYLEGWYKTDQSGEATIETAAEPLVLVVIFGKALVTREVSSKSSHQVIQLPRL